MSLDLSAELVTGAALFVFGVLFLLFAFGAIGKSRGISERYDWWHQRLALPMILLAVAFFAIGAFVSYSSLVVSAANESKSADSWSRHATSNGVCSAEFPDIPTAKSNVAFEVKSERLSFTSRVDGTFYLLSYSGLPPDAPPASDEERLDAIRDNMPAYGDAIGVQFKLVREEKTSQQGVPGRHLEFVGGKDSLIRARIFLKGSLIYRLIAVTGSGDAGAKNAGRFMASFRFE